MITPRKLRFLLVPVPLSLALSLAACGDSPVVTEPAAGVEGPAEQPPELQTEAPVVLVTEEPIIPVISGGYAPHDECKDLDGAAQFREKVAAAVADRNATAFGEWVEEDVAIGYPDGGDSFELHQRLVHPHTGLWNYLDELLPLGCAVDSSGDMVIPWSFAQNISKLGHYSAQIVQGNNVPLLAEPKEDSEVLAYLSWAVVDIIDSPRLPEDLAEVHTLNGLSGYVPWDKIREVGGHRLTVHKGDDGWKITIFASDEVEK